MRVAVLLAATVLLASCTSAPVDQGQAAAVATEARMLAPLNVWPGVAPGSEGWTQQEVQHDLGMGVLNLVVRNVTTPTITAFLPASDKATGAGVIIAPGGGFMMLSINTEGNDVARWLAERGVAAFVLKYRLKETAPDQATFMRQILASIGGLSAKAALAPQEAGWFDTEAALAAADALQGLEVVRSHAREWGVDPARIGMLGFSAGAQVTSEVLLLHNREAHLAFAAPIYGGIFGRKVAAQTGLPPVFIAVAKDDDLAYPTVMTLVDTIKESGVMPKLRVYESGGHGFGMTKSGKPSDAWIDDFYAWLGDAGVLQPAKSE